MYHGTQVNTVSPFSTEATAHATPLAASQFSFGELTAAFAEKECDTKQLHLELKAQSTYVNDDEVAIPASHSLRVESAFRRESQNEAALRPKTRREKVVRKTLMMREAATEWLRQQPK